jgi:hypothetical protein
MEDVAMLVFYLPIIIFEAMLEANANKHKVAEPAVIVVQPTTPDRQNPARRNAA